MWPFSRRQPKPLPTLAPHLPEIQPSAAILPHPDPVVASKHREIVASLARLQEGDAALSVFGASAHRYRLNPPASEQDVAAFESTHHVRLPHDYRAFLLHVASSGAGPNYGLFNSLELKESDAPHPYNESGSLVGSLSQPFPHRQAWNLPKPQRLDRSGSAHALTSEQANRTKTPEDERAEQTERKAWDTWEAQYWGSQQFDGAIPLCDVGCCLLQWLIITGDEAGHVWNDFRADFRGILPLQIGSLQRVTFLQWYQSWLQSALKKAGLNQSQ